VLTMVFLYIYIYIYIYTHTVQTCTHDMQKLLEWVRSLEDVSLHTHTLSMWIEFFESHFFVFFVIASIESNIYIYIYIYIYTDPISAFLRLLFRSVVSSEQKGGHKQNASRSDDSGKTVMLSVWVVWMTVLCSMTLPSHAYMMMHGLRNMPIKTCLCVFQCPCAHACCILRRSHTHTQLRISWSLTAMAAQTGQQAYLVLWHLKAELPVVEGPLPSHSVRHSEHFMLDRWLYVHVCTPAFEYDLCADSAGCKHTWSVLHS
jgi:hypothetical protein